MQKFVDTAGRVWVVEINVATIKRVRSLAGVNLLEVVDGELIERLSSDPILLCDVLYAVCQPQAQRDSITDEAFGIGLAGDVIADATTALVEGLVAFFPEPRRRLLEKAAAKYREVQTKALTMVTSLRPPSGGNRPRHGISRNPGAGYEPCDPCRINRAQSQVPDTGPERRPVGRRAA